MSKPVAGLLVALCAASGCGRENPAASATTSHDLLTDLTSASNLDFQHDSGIDGSYFMAQILGSGGALFDYDQDGDLDVYLVNGGGKSSANRMYRQDAAFRFADVSHKSGLADDGYGMGTALGDIDNDGDLDLFVSNYGADSLYRNEGDGRFSDVTDESGLEHSEWSTSATFLDYDRDGDLDLFVVTYVAVDESRQCTDARGAREFCTPWAFPGLPDRLYRNDGGSFRDVSGDSGIARTTSKGLGVVVADFNGDGWADIFVANDGEKNDLWVNLQDGRFEEQAIVMGAAYNLSGKPEASMGVALGDLNGDLALDLFITHFSKETNTLYIQVPGGSLQDSTAVSGLAAPSLPYTGFGTGLTDLDLDGRLDVLVVNGRVDKSASGAAAGDRTTAQPLADFRLRYAEPNSIFRAGSDGRFVEACERYADFCTTLEVSRGLMLGDIDNDGDEDIVVSNSNGPARVYRNDTPPAARWLKIRARDPALGRDAVGATVVVRAGDEAWMRPISHTYGYLVNGEAIAHFGLGRNDTLDVIEITWPDGTREEFAGGDTNRVLALSKGEGKPAL